MIISQHVYRPILIFFSITLITFGAWDLLVPRARFVGSEPAPGTIMTQVPSVVAVHFSNKLTNESQIDVTSTIKLQPSGELEYLNGSSVVTRSEIDPDDPTGKSLRAYLRPDLHEGLYWISWRTTSAPWRSVSYGKTAFGVGMKVPDSLTKDMGGVTWEHTYNYRGRRAALVGGIVILVLALSLKRIL